MFILDLYKRFFWSLEKQARYAGVNLGKNNFIASRFWSSEPYLITIGDNNQITSGVKLFTHGGGKVLENIILNLIALEKLLLVTMFI